MQRLTRLTPLLALASVLLACNLLGALREAPASAQAPSARDEIKQYKVAPSNLGQDLEDRLNAMAAKGWHVREIVPANGVNSGTTWVVYEK